MPRWPALPRQKPNPLQEQKVSTESSAMTTAPAKAYQVNRAAQLLDVSRSTIYRMVKEKRLVMVKIGKRGSRITAESIAGVLNQPQ